MLLGRRVVSCGRYMVESLRSLGLVILEMSRPCGCTVFDRVGWDVISNAPVGKAPMSKLIGCVV